MAEELTLLGIKQVKLSTYEAVAAEDRKNYLWFTRDTEHGDKAAIYFGNRKYGDVGGEGASQIEEYIAGSGITIEDGVISVNFEDFQELLDNYVTTDDVEAIVEEKVSSLQTLLNTIAERVEAMENSGATDTFIEEAQAVEGDKAGYNLIYNDTNKDSLFIELPSIEVLDIE